MADKIVVMYGGEIREIASTMELYHNPLHPYTVGLMKCIPRLNESREKLFTIEGNVPDLSTESKGCIFYPRCDRRMDICEEKLPEMTEVGKEHYVKCWHYTREVK